MGNLYVAGLSSGTTDIDAVIWKYTSAGVLDPSFGSDGIAQTDTGYEDQVKAMHIDATGSLFLTGYLWNGSNTDMVIWKFSSNGTPDTSFNSTGHIVHNNAAGGNGDDIGMDIAVDSSGKIYVTGGSNNGSNDDMVVWKYNASGSLDTGFNGTGYFVYNSSFGLDYGRGIALDTNGKAIVAGSVRSATNLSDMALWKFK